MICAWTELLRVLPEWMRTDVDRLGRDGLQELRLRLGKPPVMIDAGMRNLPGRTVSADDLNYCVNTASRYSPWASETLVQGYITAPGGHRIGICGQAAMHSGQIQTIRSVTSLCIRVARDLPGISRQRQDDPSAGSYPTILQQRTGTYFCGGRARRTFSKSCGI